MEKASSYHHGNLRQSLIKTAYTQARLHGPEVLTLRSLTRQNQVSPNAVYRHFASQEELLSAVKAVISAEVANTMERYMQKTSSQLLPSASMTHVRIQELCRGYVAFAIKEPGLFRTASSSQAGQLHDLEQLQAMPPFQMLKRVIAPFVSSGQIAASEELLVEVSLWSTIHGLATLLLDTPLQTMSQKDRELLINYSIAAALKGLGI